MYQPLDKKREELVNGLRDPEPEELVDLEEYKTPTEEKEVAELDVERLRSEKGFPEFWLKAIENDSVVTPFVQPQDRPILAYLTNVKTELMDFYVSLDVCKLG